VFWSAAASVLRYLPYPQSPRFPTRPTYDGGVAALRIDLHTHTTVSDGSDSPRELVENAVAAGVDVIGLTDHDTTAGWGEALEAAATVGLGVVPGIELSAQILDNTGQTPPLSVHVLGYLVDPANPVLVEELARIRTHRDDRLRLMVERLTEDLDVTWDEVAQGIAEGATPGRPHIASVLVAKGIVADVSEAFDYYLAPHGPYHVPHYAPRLPRALEVINQAGGVAVLAHPLSGDRRFALEGVDDVDRLVLELATLQRHGLAGVEIHHRENAPKHLGALSQAATIVGLIQTGSSDYHGDKKPNRLGENLTELGEFRKIVDRATGHPWLPPVNSGL
jgi:predicted metal-dependent phosphoesterase TrpH